MTASLPPMSQDLFPVHLGYGMLRKGFLDVAFQPSRASFTSHFLQIVVEMKPLALSHVLELWLGVSKGMLPVEYLTPTNHLFMSVKFCGDHNTVTVLR